MTTTTKPSKPKEITIKRPATGSNDGTDVYDITIEPRTTVKAVLDKLGLGQGYELRIDGQTQGLKPTDDLYSKVESGAKLVAVLVAEVA